MKRYAFGLAAGVVLAVGICFLATSNALRADDEDEKAIKEAQEAVLKIAKGNGDAKKEAEALSKKAELGNVMRIFKPRAKGGYGVGPKGLSDGIELKIIALGKKELKNADLAKQANDLKEMSDIVAAVSVVATYYAPKAKVGAKDPKNWIQYVGEMKNGADELAKAVKGGNTTAVKTAANNLASSCNNCHAEFRDN